MWYSTTKAAKKYKVASQTIRRWTQEGKFDKVEVTKGGHLRIWIQEEQTTILYCRVSSKKQESSLDTQQRLLEEQYSGKVIRDIGSGFNFQRRGFVSVLERALRGEPIKLVATTSDRITRSGFPIIKHIIELSGGSVELLEEDDTSDQFDISHLISYIASFCNSVHGKRSSKRNKEDKSVSEEQGLSSGSDPTAEESL